MSTLFDLQKEVAEICNADEWLVQGGCEAFAEDSPDVLEAVVRRLTEVSGLSIVVSTPTARRIGREAGGIAVELPDLSVRVTEVPAMSRLVPGRISALAAAQHVAAVLHSPSFALVSISQTADADSGTVSATCLFKTTTVLTDPAAPEIAEEETTNEPA